MNVSILFLANFAIVNPSNQKGKSPLLAQEAYLVAHEGVLLNPYATFNSFASA